MAVATVIATSAVMITAGSSASAQSVTTDSVGSDVDSSAVAAGHNALQGGSGSFTAKVAKIDPKTGATLKFKTLLCEWNADWKWGAGAVSQVTGSTRFYCAVVGPDSPQFTGESRARLMDDHNKAIANGDRTVIQPLDPTPTVSEVTAKVKRPKTLHVQHDMWANFITPGWVWQSHPKGCGGAGTTALKCTIDYENFKI
ncbi:hypothetical protein OG863_03500 [Streptomyces decoyicus]|uniref:Uncharacterized protein n=1 Tax=Streptomyces decoyicus TaxID=249567 RepID=A0ABZ1F9U3_9ACTN|nr:hypothetical protein [Streptomyces decoyicus]WSB67111.1 hypothetical protein OG863_03500 [Streptomyces decoyicus]